MAIWLLVASKKNFDSELNIVDHYFCCESVSKLTTCCLCSKIMTVIDEMRAWIVGMCEGGMKSTDIVGIIKVFTKTI